MFFRGFGKFPFRLILSLFVLSVFSDPAHALPSFARQTGEACSSCHVGGFGPQLTPHGRTFKLFGYTDQKDSKVRVPLSAMAVGSFTNTRKDQPEAPGSHEKTNNNFALDEASVFIAGRLAPNLGSFIQVTYSEIDHATAVDNFELRYARPFTIAGKDAVVGVIVNNNPTVQDAWNSLPAWGFPYTASELAPESLAAPLIAGGLEHQVMGASAYLWFNNSIYAEVGGYRSLASNFLDTFGIEDEIGKVSGTAPYWRLAYSKDFKRQAFSVGLFGMSAKLRPEGVPGAGDRYTDIGIDGTYQYLGTREYIFSLNASYVHEKRKLDLAYADGEASKAKGTLNSLRLDGSVYYKNTYGLTAGLFDVTGSSDEGLYPLEDFTGSRRARPNTAGYILQADWSPFGKDDSFGEPWANLRLGLQYTGYTKFNGGNSNYDGAGRKASDNNTLFLFAWTAF